MATGEIYHKVTLKISSTIIIMLDNGKISEITFGETRVIS
jgi:hypothetical protein